MVTRLLAVLYIVLAAAGIARAADVPRYIRIAVEQEEIVAGDTIVLEIEATGLEDPLDLAPLEDIGTRIRETAGTRIAVIGGKVVEVRILRIQIEPKGTGVVVVGPLAAGDVVSNSVSFRILEPADSSWVPAADDVSVVMRVAPRSTYLQAQTIVDFELRHRYPLADEKIVLPQIEGARVRPIHTERRTIEQDKGSGSRVVSWRFAVFPNRSGEIAIDAFRVKGEIVKSRRERAPFDIATKPLRVPVLPAQADAADWWLPAANVTIADEWSKNPRELAAGDEVVRTVTVTADGAQGEQIPDIAMRETRGLLITPLGARRSTEMRADGAHGKTVFEFRIRALSPIPVFTDTIRVAWWNTKDGTARETVLPARRIDIGMPNREALLKAVGEREGIVGIVRGLAERALPQSPWTALLPLAMASGALIIFLLRGPTLLAKHWESWLISRRIRNHTTAGRYADALRALRTLPSGLAVTPAGRSLDQVLEQHLFGLDGSRHSVPLFAHRAAFVQVRAAPGKRSALPEL